MAAASPTIAVLFFSHVFDRISLSRLEQLRKETEDIASFFVLTDNAAAPLDKCNANFHVFNFQELLEEYPAALGNAVIPGNTHLAIIDFFNAHPNFEHYWIVEYDVHFSGNWRDFFSAFKDSQADLICSHLRRYRDEPRWNWWSSFSLPRGGVDKEQFLRSFLPIQRLSKRAIRLLENRVREGWRGHLEGLVPTILSLEGYRLEDFGGSGNFVRAGYRNKFYTSRGFFGYGGLTLLGSMRWRPPHLVRGLRRNRLYHPVKPTGLGASEIFRNSERLVRRILGAMKIPLKKWLVRQDTE